MYLGIITERSLILYFAGRNLAKVMDPDPHWDFCLDPDPQRKQMRIRNTADRVGNFVQFVQKKKKDMKNTNSWMLWST